MRMDCSGSASRPATPLVNGALAALACIVILPIARAQHSGGCEPPDHQEQPPAGHWTGSYRLSYEMVVPNMPPGIQFLVTWEGELSFDLGRAEGEDDPPAPPPPPPPRRRPLSVKPPTSSALPPEMFVDCCNDEQAAAILAATQEREAANEAEVQRVLQWYADNLPPNHLYIQPGKNAIIQGTATSRMQTTFGGAMAGNVAMRGSGQGNAPVDYEIKGEETDPEVGFTEIELWGIPGLMDFSGSNMVTAPGGSGQASVTMDRGGMRGRTVGTDDRGHTATADYSGANPMTPGEKTKFAALKIESRECWELRGTVDESILKERHQTNGVGIRVIASEWSATLDERDEEWEKQVDQLAAEPIPAELTWEYIDNFKDRWFALRGIGRLVMSDYKRCILKKLEDKFIRINVAALQVYVDNFPKADENATCGVMRAALQRMLPIMQLLQLYGLGDCPLIERAWTTAEGEMQLLVQQILARKYTMRDLECFIGVYRNGFLDFGDQTQPMAEAIHAMEQAAANARAEWVPATPAGAGP
jgi:hypothetical protein